MFLMLSSLILLFDRSSILSKK